MQSNSDPFVIALKAVQVARGIVAGEEAVIERPDPEYLQLVELLDLSEKKLEELAERYVNE